VVAHSEFVREFAQAVADLSLEQAFGLGILHQRPEFNVPGTTIFESLSLKNRTTEAVVIPHSGQSEELGGVTLWHFTKQDGLTGRNRCAHGNSVHCCGN
jgi:hypothetical protein